MVPLLPCLASCLALPAYLLLPQLFRPERLCVYPLDGHLHNATASLAEPLYVATILGKAIMHSSISVRFHGLLLRASLGQGPMRDVNRATKDSKLANKPGKTPAKAAGTYPLDTLDHRAGSMHGERVHGSIGLEPAVQDTHLD